MLHIRPLDNSKGRFILFGQKKKALTKLSQSSGVYRTFAPTRGMPGHAAPRLSQDNGANVSFATAQSDRDGNKFLNTKRSDCEKIRRAFGRIKEELYD